MFRIIEKEELATTIKKLEIKAPDITRNASCGQFVIMIADEKGERIPLTLVDWNKKKGTITVIFQEVGFSTKKLGSLSVGDSILHILGPLGHPTELKKWAEVICIGGGVGIAEVYPVARGFRLKKNKVIGIIGARSKDLLILEKEMKKVCAELYITTDDGSYGRKGFVTDILKDLLKNNLRLSSINQRLVYAVGPVGMMKAVAELTRPYNIKTIVSLNPILVDATGMCGSCRVHVGGKTYFGCVDGPDFDAHQVDFEELQKRLNLFRVQERQL